MPCKPPNVSTSLANLGYNAKDLQLPDSVSLLMCSVVLRAKSEGSKGFMRDTWLGPNFARDAWKPQNRNVIRETSNACEALFIF